MRAAHIVLDIVVGTLLIPVITIGSIVTLIAWYGREDGWTLRRLWYGDF